MRIRTEFAVMMLLFSVMLAVIAASAIITNAQAVKAVEGGQLAGQIAQGASELSYLSNDYMIYREAQQRTRWLARYAALADQVAGLRVTEPGQQALVRSVQASARRMKEVFDSIEAAPQANPADPAQLQIAWSRMAVQAQALMIDAGRLAALLQDQADRLMSIRTWLTYSMIGVFGIYFLANYLVTQRRILRSIANLQAGTAVIGSGDLDYTIAVEREDEIGELSRAFNEMAVNLKNVMAARAAERQVAEDALRASRAQLQAYARKLVDASETERRTIARELHDEAGQAIASMKMHLGMIQRDPECPESIASRLDDLKQVADDVVDDLRKLATELRPGALDRGGLLPAMGQYITQFAERTGLDVQLAARGLEGVRLPSEVETNLYRITQEALTNIARYAGAAHIGVVIELQDGQAVLIIEDDGEGFDPDEAWGKGHLGLLGMHERAEMLQGTLEIETAPGRGTTIFVTAPCGQPPAGREA